jgi:hypothetical protein
VSPSFGYVASPRQPLFEGMILRFHDDTTNPPKTKFMVVVSFSLDETEIGVVYINTTPNPFFTIPDRQVLIKADNRNLVDYDSWVDCTKLTVKSKEDIQEKINGNHRLYRGKINGKELFNIREKIMTSPGMSVIEKRRFGMA